MDFDINEIAKIETGSNQDGSPVNGTADAVKSGNLSSAVS